ncbi:hypothetical protein GCK32_021168 [Trichostrongylus colubriformis]|uniref:Uncharacterized protein n=1 Tax=Trichostrongylus colubriformis TaxID=6319 RepID=A0AAN8EVB2_TRICO
MCKFRVDKHSNYLLFSFGTRFTARMSFPHLNIFSSFTHASFMLFSVVDITSWLSNP